MDIFSFLLGLLILYKGEFRIANRSVDRYRARQIGLLLMLPLAVGVIAALVFLPAAMGTTTVSPDGDVLFDNAALESTINTLLVISLITFILVGAAVAYIILNIPPDGAPARPTSQRTTSSMWSAQPAARPEDPREADEAERSAEPSQPARPQRPQIRHPLEGGGFYSVTRPVARPAASRPAPGAPKSIMTVAEAAAYLNLTEAEVEALINEGKLAAVKGSGGYRIARLAADDYKESIGQA
ncbi:MAG: helix-turn-helix domain-containing protein [Candidatus Flexifilum sp.]